MYLIGRCGSGRGRSRKHGTAPRCFWPDPREGSRRATRSGSTRPPATGHISRRGQGRKLRMPGWGQPVLRSSRTVPTSDRLRSFSFRRPSSGGATSTPASERPGAPLRPSARRGPDRRNKSSDPLRQSRPSETLRGSSSDASGPNEAVARVAILLRRLNDDVCLGRVWRIANSSRTAR
jgi:hypothetical protein